MAKIEINVEDICTTIDQMWQLKEGEKKEDDKHKERQKKPVRDSQ